MMTKKELKPFLINFGVVTQFDRGMQGFNPKEFYESLSDGQKLIFRRELERSENIHLGFRKMLAEKRSFRPAPETEIRIVGWGEHLYGGEPVVDVFGRIGGLIETDKIIQVKFRRKRGYWCGDVMTEMGTFYTLIGPSADGALHPYAERRFREASDQDYEDAAEKYFELI